MALTDLRNSRAHFNVVFLSLLVVLFGEVARSEITKKYAPWYVDDQNTTAFFLSGDIDGRAALNFDRVVTEFGAPEVLILSSNGGLVSDALLIAKRAHELGLKTFIPADGACYSACSLIFLAGISRIADGKLGVHQISSSNGDLSSGQVAISDILDILGKFDVPNDLIVDMFRTPSEEMYIVTDEEKQRFGFFLRTEAERALDVGPPMELRAADFLINYNEIWSKPNIVAIDGVSEFYSDTIRFFGSQKSKSDVLADKIAFSQRWPLRKYTVIGSTISASCKDFICHISANVEWHAVSVSSGKVSDGLALEIFVVDLSNDLIRILEEDGHVLKRY